jgi:hypothetical protein
MQLAGWSAVGCLINFAANSLPSRHILSRGHSVIVFLLLLALGIALNWLAWERLNDGIRNEKWSDESIAPLRRLTQRSAFTVIPLVALLVLLAISTFSGHFRGSDLYWSTFWTNMVLGQLKLAVKPPKTTTTEAVWQNAAPIRSEHWGESSQSLLTK